MSIWVCQFISFWGNFGLPSFTILPQFIEILDSDWGLDFGSLRHLEFQLFFCRFAAMLGTIVLLHGPVFAELYLDWSTVLTFDSATLRYTEEFTVNSMIARGTGLMAANQTQINPPPLSPVLTLSVKVCADILFLVFSTHCAKHYGQISPLWSCMF